MTLHQRVEVLIARSGGCTWVPGQVVGFREEDGYDERRVIVRADDGTYLPNCNERSIRAVLFDATDEGSEA